MDLEEAKKLLKMARQVLENKFKGRDYRLEKIPASFQEKKGVFVSLHQRGELRGCIGYIFPIKTISEGVKENVLNAAFHDPRFSSLQKKELKEVKIEISLLSQPVALEFSSPQELLEKLTGKEGVILEKNRKQATFLPQVWEALPDKEEFLEHLSRKAGLSSEAWKEARIWVYLVEIWGEE